VALAKESTASFAFWFHASGWRKAAARLIEGQIVKDRGQEKQSDRDAKVSRIQIFPGDLTVNLGDRVRFAAVAYDRGGTPVGGVKIKLSGQSAVPSGRVRISRHGEFEGITAGTFNIVAEGAGKTTAVTILVRPGIRRNLNLAPTGTRHVSTRDLPTTVASQTNSLGQKVAQNAGTRASKIKGRNSRLRAHANRSKASPSSGTFSTNTPEPLLPADGWGDSNYLSADDPGNSVGDPPGGAMDDGAGSGNFQIAAPVLGLPGRGIDISLGLAYNSRLWNKAGSQISFDNDRGWPAPGWSLGFGKMLGMGVYNGGMLVDADGTRHGYAGTVTEFPWGTNFVGHTTDGTFIDYTYTTGTNGVMLFGEAKLPNGTVVSYGATGPGGLYPTSIKDPNGNYITITYVNNSGPRIQTVVDTLNRPINFHYDANNFLTAITGPGLNNTERTLVRLNYRQISLNYSFSGLTPGVRDPQPWVINAIYYPGTNTGYWFGESNSYSTYGMLARVSERRNMTFSAASLNDQGTVTYAGEITREEIYNYPLTTSDPGGSGLTDAPTYTSLTETWTRDGVNTDQAVTSYSSQPNASPRTVTITLPNGTKSIQYSHNSPGNFLDGLVFQDQTLDSANNVLQSSSVQWQQGAYASPRPLRVEATNELLQMTATEFSYGNVYNQVTEVRNYDYGGVSPVRVTRTQYENSSSYTGQQFSWGHSGRHIFNLPLVVEVFAGDGATRVSKTEYQYDGQTLTDTPGVVMHDDTHNPYAPQYEVCECNQWDHWQIECLQWNCYWTSSYSAATDYRGNVTQVTSYSDAVNSSGAVTETRRYDITGNLLKASSSCCEQTTFNYTVDTQYAYPLSQTRGSATDAFAQVTTSATYDFNTGLVLSGTDANGRVSETSYHASTLRPITSIAPTDAHTDYVYNDGAMTVTSTTYAGPGVSAIADQNVKLLNGRGQVRQEQARAADNGSSQVWDLADVIYNNLGQVSQQSRPYRSGQTPQFSTAIYDALGRTTRVTAPDGSVTETYYNEKDFDTSDGYVPQRPSVASSAPGETTLVRDAWGRERWGRTDAQGRLVEVVEPNPSGNGSVFEAGALVTTYTYTTLGNLIQVNQGEQTRSFKYDSLGRLTAQRLAETSATLNDAGTYQAGGNGTWSDVFTYDVRSNLTSRTDARGVKTIYSFFIGGNPNTPDPLNRLQSVSWDISGFGDTANPILPAATVNYAYRTKDTQTQLRDVTQLSSVTTSGVSTESYDYDPEGRMMFKRLVANGRPPMDTNYFYDNLDRVTDVDYPAKNFALPQTTRPRVHHDYDIASRLTSLTIDGDVHASNIVYNAASQTTSLSVGAAGSNQTIESYNYESQTGLLASQTIARAATPTNYLLNLAYDYAGANGKRTGQLTKILNNLNHNKDRSYSYDALGRLTQAKGGPATAPLWTQTYTYDRYGNRTSVSASGNSASLRGSTDLQSVTAANKVAPIGTAGVSPAVSAQREPAGTEPGAVATGYTDPKVSLPTDQLSLRTDASRSTSSHHASRSARTNAPTPQGSPPVFTDDPLIAGVTVIKAVHITELRTAINQARSRALLPAANWAESVTSGVPIKAAHIAELRLRLDEARAALSMSPAFYTDPTLTVGVTAVKAVHVQQLRQYVSEAITTSFAIPVDGHANLSYDLTTNRITTAGFAYDAAGNQVRALIPGSSNSQRFQYDAANRLVHVKSDNNQTVIASYTYGDSNERLILEEAGVRTYYACDGSAEYTETGGSTTPQWSKTYIYLGARLLSTLTPNGSGHFVQYHHPDRLGTRLVTNAQDTNSFEQVTLPFGSALSAESTGATNRRFTTYDRSLNTGLDYALNRHYDPQQGRFTQVDPIEMDSVELENPQTLNLYAYCTNDPINHTDPSGLGFFSFLKKVLRIVNAVLLTIAAILQPNPYSVSAAITAWIDVFGSKRLRGIANLVNSVAQSIGAIVRPSGNYWQQQEPIYDEGDVIRTTTNAPGPWWDSLRNPPTTFNLSWIWRRASDTTGPVRNFLVRQAKGLVNRELKVIRCFEGNRFSAAVSHTTQGTRLNGAATFAAQSAEILPSLSVAGDIAATVAKAGREGFGGPKQPLASGINWAFRRVSKGSVRGFLVRQIGDRATNAFRVTAAFTTGYNAVQGWACQFGLQQ
jgi:RHS repeat-associated protein